VTLSDIFIYRLNQSKEDRRAAPANTRHLTMQGISGRTQFSARTTCQILSNLIINTVSKLHVQIFRNQA